MSNPKSNNRPALRVLDGSKLQTLVGGGIGHEGGGSGSKIWHTTDYTKQSSALGYTVSRSDDPNQVKY